MFYFLKLDCVWMLLSPTHRAAAGISSSTYGTNYIFISSSTASWVVSWWSMLSIFLLAVHGSSSLANVNHRNPPSEPKTCSLGSRSNRLLFLFFLSVLSLLFCLVTCEVMVWDRIIMRVKELESFLLHPEMAFAWRCRAFHRFSMTKTWQRVNSPVGLDRLSPLWADRSKQGGGLPNTFWHTTNLWGGWTLTVQHFDWSLLDMWL